MMGRFCLSDFLEEDWKLFQGDDSLSSRDFLKLTARRYTQLKLANLGQKRVGLRHELPVPFLANFLALLALDCEVILIPHYLTPSHLQRLTQESHLEALITSFELSSFPAPELSISLENSRFVILTSGSRGSPKGVVHHWKNLKQGTQGFQEHWGLDKLSWGQSLPLFHGGGLMSFFRPFFAKGSYVTARPFSVDKLNSEGANILSLVPTQLWRFLEQGQGKNLRPYSLILLGGAPLGESLYRRAKREGLSMAFSYGLTEMMATVAMQKKRTAILILRNPPSRPEDLD